MSQNSKWSSWQQLKPTKQETPTITETIELTTLVTETLEEVTPVDEVPAIVNESATTEEVAPKPAKKRNVNV